MITRLISDITTRQITKRYMIFHIIGRNRNRFTLFPFNTNYIPIIPHLKQNICHFLHFTN